MAWPKYFMDAPLRENLERFCAAFMQSGGSDCPWHIVDAFHTIVGMARESMHTRWMMGFVWELAAHLGQGLFDDLFGDRPLGLRGWDLLTQATRSWMRAGAPESVGSCPTSVTWEVVVRLW